MSEKNEIDVIEEIVSELDKLGYELDLNALDKDTLIDIYFACAKLTEEDKAKALKNKETTLVKKCLALGDSIDLDLLPEKVLRKLLKSVTGSSQVSESTKADSAPGEKLEEAREKRNKATRKDPESIANITVTQSSEGIVIQKGARSPLKKIENVSIDKIKELQKQGILAGYDPTKKIAYVKGE